MSNVSLKTKLNKTTFYQPWWATALLGAVLFIFGLFATIWSADTVFTLVRLVGVFFFIDGLLLVLLSVANNKHDIRWKATLGRGIAGTLVGLVIFLLSLSLFSITSPVLIYIAAALAFFHGIMDAIKAFRAYRETKNEWVIVFSSVFFIALGALLLVSLGGLGFEFVRAVGIVGLVVAAGFFIFSWRQYRKLR